MKTRNIDIVRTFTSRLAELCRSGVPLKEALGVLKDLKGFEKGVRILCAEILDALESGTNFSMALKRSEIAGFPQWYIGFIEVSEKSGDLEKTLDFLNATLEKNHSDWQMLISNLLYPTFLVFLALSFGIVLEKIFGSQNFLRALLFLSNVCLWLVVAVKKIFGEKPMLFFLNAMKFLWERDIPFSQSLETASICISENQKLFSAVTKIKDDIMEGKNISETFRQNLCEAGFSFEGKILSTNLSLYEASGTFASNKENRFSPFEKTLSVVRTADERRKKLFLRIEQPLLLAVAAIFILMVVGNLGFLYEVKI